jgi:hypothetical protein
VPRTHQCGACILRASFLCSSKWPSAIEARQGRAGNSPVGKENDPSRGRAEAVLGCRKLGRGVGTELTTPCMAIGSKIPACSTSWWGGAARNSESRRPLPTTSNCPRYHQKHERISPF